MAERHLTVRRQMAAPCPSVWAVFADFPNLADHWNGLKASQPIGDQTHGLGARRQVSLRPVDTGFSAMVTAHSDATKVRGRR